MRIVPRPTRGASFRFTASWAMSRTLHRAWPSGGGLHTMAMMRWLWPASRSRCPPGCCFSYSAGQSRARFSGPRPRCRPPAPPSAPGQAGAGSKPASAPAPIPGLCSASRRSASDPSCSDGHSPDGRLACPHYAACLFTPPVPDEVHLPVVENLVPSATST